MIYEIVQEKRKFWELKFNEEVPTTDYTFDLPFLVDDTNAVVFGNSMRKNYDAMDIVDCVMMKKSDYLSGPLAGIETEIMIENSQERFYEIEAELKNYLAKFNNKFTNMSLFDLRTLAERDFITVENYKQPVQYDYTQHNMVRDEEDEEAGYAGLFSDAGER